MPKKLKTLISRLILLLLLASTALGIAVIQQMRKAQEQEAITDYPLRNYAEAIDNFSVGAVIRVSAIQPSETIDPFSQYNLTHSRNYSIAVPEGAFRWSYLHNGGRYEYDFTKPNRAVEYARLFNMELKGHTLMWHNCEMLPDWLYYCDLDTGIRELRVPKDQLRAIYKEHVEKVVGEFKGKVKYWDVINEPFDAQGNITTLFPYGEMGPSIIPDMFKWAHAADPNAKLFLNENGCEGSIGGLAAKSDGLYNYVKNAVEQDGIPIHGVGLQMHLKYNEDFHYPGVTFESHIDNYIRAVDENITRLSLITHADGTKVQVHISELDFDLQLDGQSDAEVQKRLSQQAELYGKIAIMCAENPGCTALITWGFSDGVSWLNYTVNGVKRTANDHRGLPFDENYQPKLAYHWMREEIKRRSGTPVCQVPFAPHSMYAKYDQCKPGETIDLYCQVPITEGVNKFHFQIDDEPSFSSPLVFNRTDASTYIETNVPSGTLYCRAKASLSDGSCVVQNKWGPTTSYSKQCGSGGELPVEKCPAPSKPDVNIYLPVGECTGADWLTVAWAGMSGAYRYRVEIADGHNFGYVMAAKSNIGGGGGVDGYTTFTGVPKPLYGTYYARVRIEESDGSCISPGEWSKFDYTTCTGYPPPNTCQALPKPSMSANCGTYNEYSNVTCSWNSAPYTKEYKVEIADNTSFNSPAVWENVTGTSITFNSAPYKNYYCRVRTETANDICIPPSLWSSAGGLIKTCDWTQPPPPGPEVLPPTPTPIPTEKPTPAPTREPTNQPTMPPVTDNFEPQITTRRLSGATQGKDYKSNIEANDKNQDDNLSMYISNLPEGLYQGNCSFSYSRKKGDRIVECKILGTPTKSETRTVGVAVYDGKGGYDQRSYELKVKKSNLFNRLYDDVTGFFLGN